MSDTTSTRRMTMICFVLAVASGVPSLVYQVAWTREIALLIGSHVEAIATVLAAFFGGLAAGSRVLGAFADRTVAPLRLYGLLEILAGVATIASPWLLQVIGDHLVGSLPGPAVLAVSGGLLFAITFLLGGTLPALLRTATAVRLNTAGAVAGVAAAAAAIPLIGLRLTLTWAGLVAVAVGVVAWLIGRPGGQASREPRPGGTATPSGPLLVAAVGGVATIGFEVLAARSAALVLGSSLYAWALILILFLIGLAGGNLLAARRAVTSPRPMAALGLIEAVAGVLLVAGMTWAVPDPARPAVGVTWPALAAVAMWVLPATVLMGAAFPFFVRLGIRDDAGIGRSFGAIAAANTAGGIAGALIAPFVLLPGVGLLGGLLCCGAINTALGIALLTAGTPGRVARVLRPVLAAMLMLLATGIALLPRQLLGDQGTVLLAVHHGRQATAAVARHSSGRRDLIVDGDPEASTAGDARRTEEMLGILPIIMHPNPQDLLEVGLGSGITLGTASQHPLRSLTCVEISAAVRACAEMFEPDNHGVASGRDERIEIIVGDGRAFLRGRDQSYDVIVANTLHPWSVGATGLYSSEYFERIRRALRPGGIAGQWVPVHRIGGDSLAAILRTFFEVFPDGALWWGAENVIVIGRRGESGELQPRFDDAAGMLERIGIDSMDELMRRRLASAATTMQTLGPGTVLTDDRPILEALGARRRGTGSSGELELVARIAAAGAEASPAAAPIGRWLEARVLRDQGKDKAADALEVLARAGGLRLVDQHAAQRLIIRGQQRLANDEPLEAETAFAAALRHDPVNDEAMFGLAVVAHDRNRTNETTQRVDALLQVHTDHASGWLLRATLESARGDRARALAAAERSLELDPYSPQAIAAVGVLAARSGDLDKARRMAERLQRVTSLLSGERLALQQAINDASP